MKKRLLSLLSAITLGCYVFSSASVVYAKETELESSGIERGVLLYESDVITRKDYEEGFRNYALPEATINLAADTRSFSDIKFANVVGVVKDYDTEEHIANAEISIDGEWVVVTGQDGRFQIENLPSDVYDWEVGAQGYCSADYFNYDVDASDGTTIFTFYLSEDFSIVKDREELIHNTDGEETIPPDVIDRGTFVTSASNRSMSAVPTVRNTVKVYYNGQTHYIDREMYIYTVVSSEMYSTSAYTGWGLTLAQTAELYRAQALAANTFLEYAMSVYSKHSSVNCDVCASACCQTYDPTKVTQAAINATTNIFYSAGSGERTDIVMYKETPATYDYIWGLMAQVVVAEGL